MNRKITLTVLLTSFLFCSCAQNANWSDENEKLSPIELTNEEISSIAFDEAGELSEKEAIEILKEFLDAHNQAMPETRGGSSASFEVQSKCYVGEDLVKKNPATRLASEADSQKSLDIPVFEIIVKSSSAKGLALVSADERAPKVIGFIPNLGDEKILDDMQLKMLKEMSKIALVQDVRNVELTKSALREQTLTKLSNQWGIPVDRIHYDNIVNNITITTNTRTAPGENIVDKIPTQIFTSVGPLSKTAWDQNKPYNRMLPSEKLLYWGNLTDGNRIAGCGVVAIAELFATIESTGYFDGVKMNWTRIKTVPELIENTPESGQAGMNSPIDILNMVGRLVKSIYYDTNTQAVYSMHNGIRYNSGSSTSVSEMERYVQSKTYCDSPRNFDPDICKASLDGIRPVLLYGDFTVYPPAGDTYRAGHGFLIDGYAIARKQVRQLVKTNDVYWHVNFGWGKFGKGYFKLSTDTNCTMRLETDNGLVEINTNEQKMISNVRTK